MRMIACKCKVTTLNGEPWIQFCSLHGAADELAKAAEMALREFRGLEKSGAQSTSVVFLEEALRKARKK